MNPNKFTGRIAVIGAGAVGGFVGGKLAAAGHDVTLIDAWPEHVNAIQQSGLIIAEPNGTNAIRVPVLHRDDVSSLPPQWLDVVFVCVKLYDTEQAVKLVLPHLKPIGCVITLQNSLVESIVAAQVGWSRTLGCIGSGMYVAMEGPGRIRRNKTPLKNGPCVFYIGEAQGLRSTRVGQLAAMLSQVDVTEVTDNLWGMRWAKLVANTMTSGFTAVCDLTLKQAFGNPLCCRIMLRLAAEAISVGAALGYATEAVFGLEPEVWLKANAGDAGAFDDVKVVLRKQHALVTEDAIAGTAQDLRRGRRTEVEFMNGFVALKAAEVHVPAPLHAEVASVIRRLEASQDSAGDRHLQRLEALMEAQRG